MRSLVGRLRVCWYGPAAGLIAFAFILFVPLIKDCIAISAVRGGQGGIFCSQVTPFWGSTWTAMAVVGLGAMLILILQLISSDPRYLVAIGAASAAVWLALIFALLPNYQFLFWLSAHGLEVMGNELGSELVFMLPSAILPVAAGARELRRSPGRSRA